MKKHELQALVKECIQEVFSEGYDEFQRADKGSKGVAAKDKAEEDTYGAGYKAGERAAKAKYKKLAEAFWSLKKGANKKKSPTLLPKHDKNLEFPTYGDESPEEVARMYAAVKKPSYGDESEEEVARMYASVGKPIKEEKWVEKQQFDDYAVGDEATLEGKPVTIEKLYINMEGGARAAKVKHADGSIETIYVNSLDESNGLDEEGFGIGQRGMEVSDDLDKSHNLDEANLGHNETSSIHQEGRFWIVTYRTADGKKEKSFESEKEARKFYNTLNEARFKKGTDIGKPGKGFEKVAKAGEKQYGSKEAGQKVAGAILKKVLAKKGK